MKKAKRGEGAPLAIVFSALSMLLALPLGAQNICWPQDGRPAPAPSIPHDESKVSGPTSVYFDASGSMATYVRTPAKDAGAEPLLPSLLLLLPQVLAAAGEQVDFYEFGKKTANDKTVFPKLKETQLLDLAKPAYYCLNTGVCRYQDSPIADAFKQMADQPANALGMVITDLFLSNSELVGTGALELQLPLTKALREGRAIAILALKSSSTGPIYDLTAIDKNKCYDRKEGLGTCKSGPPDNYIGSQYYSGATSRPLFVVMIGPASRILDFKQKLDSELLTKRVAADQQHFTIFIKQGQKAYRPVESWPKDMFKAGGRTEKGNFLNSFFSGGFPGEQVVLPINGPGVTADVDLSKLWTPGVPAPAKLSFEPKSWYQRGDSCTSMWHAQTEASTARFVKFESKGALKGQLHIAQPSPRATGLFSNFPSYLVAGSFTASDFELDRWFDEWGYNELDEMRRLDQKPAFFPAKNLPRIGKVLVDIIQEKAEPAPLGEFRLGLKVR